MSEVLDCTRDNCCMAKQEDEDDLLERNHSSRAQWIEDSNVVAIDYAVDAAQQKTHFDCPRCRGESWSGPALIVEQRREAAALVRRKQMLETLEFFRLAGFTFVAAKRTMLHITIVEGKCHRCRRELPNGSEHVVCRCRSLNLNW